MAKNSADLRLARAHRNAAHEPRQPLSARDELRRPALAQASEIDELHLKPTEAAGHLEHLRLQGLGEVPGGLPAHGRVEDENEPPAARGRRRRRPARLLTNAATSSLAPRLATGAS